MPSTYLRLRQKTGRYLPFPPPLPSPKHTGSLSLKQGVHLALWRAALPIWSATIGKHWATCKPIFPIGCHNSGTTILAWLIQQHPAVAGWSEAPEVWAPDDMFLNWGGMEAPSLPRPFLFDLLAYQRTVREHGEYIPLIRDVFSLFAASRLKSRFLSKNPHMAISVPYIEAIFPDSQYIYIRRNGYAVVQSLVSNWRPVLQDAATNPQSGWRQLRETLDSAYFDDPLALVRQCARYWAEIDQRAIADLKALPDQRRVYTTTYEDLCQTPEVILREIFAQFELHPAHYNWSQLQHPTRYPWTTMLPMENRNFKYRERMTREEIRAVTQEIGDVLAEYGYLDEMAP